VSNVASGILFFLFPCCLPPLVEPFIVPTHLRLHVHTAPRHLEIGKKKAWTLVFRIDDVTQG